MRRRSPGWWLQVLGAVHGPLGLLLYRDPLRDIARAGVVRAVPGLGDRSTAFWFVASAPMMWVGGRLLRSSESNDDLAAQRAAGLVLTVVGIAGSAAIPVSGFPGIAAVGIWSLSRSLRRR